jgi:methylenetetrahydrofolate reductase (NADPH)
MSVDEILERAFQNRAFSKAFFLAERKMKEWLFDCQSCGNCVLSHTGFVCPMRCPKGQRNGPCGGAMDGMCEVDTSKRCVWDEIWESTVRLDRVDLLTGNYEGPPDWRLYGTSAWENMVAGRLESPSIFETLFRKDQPLLREGPRVVSQLLRNWVNLITGPSWRRYEGRPPL